MVAGALIVHSVRFRSTLWIDRIESVVRAAYWPVIPNIAAAFCIGRSEWQERKPQTVDATEAIYDSRWGDLIAADRFAITETNFTASAGDFRADSTDWMMARVGNWFQRRGVGMGWFATINYSPSKLLIVFSGGGIQMPSQSLFASYYNLACMSDRQGDLTSAIRSGHQTLHRVHASRGIYNTAYDPERVVTDSIQYYTLGVGGRGVCVLTGDDDAINFLYGGPARITVAWMVLVPVTTPAVFISDDDFTEGIGKLFRDQGMYAIEYVDGLPVVGDFTGQLVFLTPTGSSIAGRDRPGSETSSPRPRRRLTPIAGRQSCWRMPPSAACFAAR